MSVSNTIPDVVLERADAPLRHETMMRRASDRPADAAIDEARDHDARRVAREVVARFVRDPAAFADAARVGDRALLLEHYRQGLDRRLDALVGVPTKSPERLATLGAGAMPRMPGDDLTREAETAPRMGPVLVAAAVISALAAAVSASVAVYTVMTKHKPL